MKSSQQKLYDWYKKHTNRFDNIESIEELDSGEVEIITEKENYLIGKKGGLKQFKNKVCSRCEDKPLENRYGDYVICTRCGK